MFTKKGSFSVLLIFTAFINSFNCFSFGKTKSRVEVLEEDRLKREKEARIFEQSEKAVNARVIAMSLIFPLGDSFMTSLQGLFDEMDAFFKQASAIDRSVNRVHAKEWSEICNFYRSLTSYTYSVSSLKDAAESSAEKIRNRLMFLQNDLANGRLSTSYTKSEVNKLLRVCNTQLDEYVKRIGKLFDRMSDFRHDLVGFGQKVVRAVSQNRSIDNLSMLQKRFCESLSVQNYKGAFKNVKDAFNAIKAEFKRGSRSEPYPESFVNLVGKILDFQSIKFNEVQRAVIGYTESGNAVDAKFKATVDLSMCMIDFDYLYDLSTHLLKLYNSIKLTNDENNNDDIGEEE